MASGVPVVAPDAGGPRELVRHGRTGYLVPPGASGALRAAVVRLRDDAVLRHSFGRAGRRAVRGRDWPALCDELLDHYRAVVHRRPVTQVA
jgi:phosphatidylinositol alpha 1,6-mannosyltransferase